MFGDRGNIMRLALVYTDYGSKDINQMIQEYGIEKAGLYYPRSLYNSFIGLDYAYLPSTILYTIFPLLVTLPHAISYYRDKKNGYIKIY